MEVRTSGILECISEDITVESENCTGQFNNSIYYEETQPYEEPPKLNVSSSLEKLKNYEKSSSSAVDIRDECTTSIDLPPISWHGYGCSPRFLNVTNTGQTIVINGQWVSGRPYIKGGPLNGTYMFSQIHFHCPSEHELDGRRYPLEMHVVHYKTSYLTQERAMNEKDGTVVLVYLFQVGNGETALSTITRLGPQINKLNSRAETKELTLDQLVKPFCANYYVYWGKLTTEKHTYLLQWIINCNVLQVSHQEVEDLITLMSSEDVRKQKTRMQPENSTIFHVGEEDCSMSITDSCSPETESEPCHHSGCMHSHQNAGFDEGEGTPELIYCLTRKGRDRRGCIGSYPVSWWKNVCAKSSEKIKKRKKGSKTSLNEKEKSKKQKSEEKQRPRKRGSKTTVPESKPYQYPSCDDLYQGSYAAYPDLQACHEQQSSYPMLSSTSSYKPPYRVTSPTSRPPCPPPPGQLYNIPLPVYLSPTPPCEYPPPAASEPQLQRPSTASQQPVSPKPSISASPRTSVSGSPKTTPAPSPKTTPPASLTPKSSATAPPPPPPPPSTPPKSTRRSTSVQSTTSQAAATTQTVTPPPENSPADSSESSKKSSKKKKKISKKSSKIQKEKKKKVREPKPPKEKKKKKKKKSDTDSSQSQSQSQSQSHSSECSCVCSEESLTKEKTLGKKEKKKKEKEMEKEKKKEKKREKQEAKKREKEMKKEKKKEKKRAKKKKRSTSDSSLDSEESYEYRETKPQKEKKRKRRGSKSSSTSSKSEESEDDSVSELECFEPMPVCEPPPEPVCVEPYPVAVPAADTCEMTYPDQSEAIFADQCDVPVPDPYMPPGVDNGSRRMSNKHVKFQRNNSPNFECRDDDITTIFEKRRDSRNSDPCEEDRLVSGFHSQDPTISYLLSPSFVLDNPACSSRSKKSSSTDGGGLEKCFDVLNLPINNPIVTKMEKSVVKAKGPKKQYFLQLEQVFCSNEKGDFSSCNRQEYNLAVTFNNTLLQEYNGIFHPNKLEVGSYEKVDLIPKFPDPKKLSIRVQDCFVKMESLDQLYLRTKFIVEDLNIINSSEMTDNYVLDSLEKNHRGYFNAETQCGLQDFGGGGIDNESIVSTDKYLQTINDNFSAVIAEKCLEIMKDFKGNKVSFIEVNADKPPKKETFDLSTKKHSESSSSYKEPDFFPKGYMDICRDYDCSAEGEVKEVAKRDLERLRDEVSEKIREKLESVRERASENIGNKNSENIKEKSPREVGLENTKKKFSENNKGKTFELMTEKSSKSNKEIGSVNNRRKPIEYMKDTFSDDKSIDSIKEKSSDSTDERSLEHLKKPEVKFLKLKETDSVKTDFFCPNNINTSTSYVKSYEPMGRLKKSDKFEFSGNRPLELENKVVEHRESPRWSSKKCASESLDHFFKDEKDRIMKSVSKSNSKGLKGTANGQKKSLYFMYDKVEKDETSGKKIFVGSFRTKEEVEAISKGRKLMQGINDSESLEKTTSSESEKKKVFLLSKKESNYGELISIENTSEKEPKTQVKAAPDDQKDLVVLHKYKPKHIDPKNERLNLVVGKTVSELHKDSKNFKRLADIIGVDKSKKPKISVYELEETIKDEQNSAELDSDSRKSLSSQTGKSADSVKSDKVKKGRVEITLPDALETTKKESHTALIIIPVDVESLSKIEVILVEHSENFKNGDKKRGREVFHSHNCL